VSDEPSARNFREQLGKNLPARDAFVGTQPPLGGDLATWGNTARNDFSC